MLSQICANRTGSSPNIPQLIYQLLVPFSTLEISLGSNPSLIRNTLDQFGQWHQQTRSLVYRSTSHLLRFPWGKPPGQVYNRDYFRHGLCASQVLKLKVLFCSRRKSSAHSHIKRHPQLLRVCCQGDKKKHFQSENAFPPLFMGVVKLVPLCAGSRRLVETCFRAPLNGRE